MNTEKNTDTSPGAEAQTSQYYELRGAKYNIVSLVGYLIGVEKKHFQADYPYLQLKIFENLDKDKNARQVRNLCRVRTAFERNFNDIRSEFRYTLKNIGSLPELIPSDAVQQLAEDGIVLMKTRPDCQTYQIAINKELSNRIGNCKSLFPEWLKWEYIKALFIMPNGTKAEGLEAAFHEYNKDRNRYPYQCYIHWTGAKGGNILYCDEKFVTMLYEAHEDVFEDLSLVKDVGAIIKDSINTFIENSEKTIVVVDCENSDSIRLAAALSGFPKSGLSKISKVLLFDSNYTDAGWRLLSNGEGAPASGTMNWSVLSKVAAFPIERKTVERLYEHKSQVDMTLALETSKEVYKNGVDSVILVSSDSDYWAMIQALSEVHFLVMVEKSKCGAEIKRALESKNIRYCYLDDFYTGASYAIKTTALADSIQSKLDERIRLNTKKLLKEALHNTWVQMTEKEKNTFYERYLKKIRAEIDAKGNIRLLLGT